jgi:hypothetical protein
MIDCGRAVGLIPAIIPRLATAPVIAPTINPLICDELKSGSSDFLFLLCAGVRRVALVVGRFRLTLFWGVAIVT